MPPAPKIFIPLFFILAMLAACSDKKSGDKEWSAQNLNADIPGSYCYDSQQANCDRYGRLYTWELAISACASLGDGWRLPSQEEWRELAEPYGGVFNDSTSDGKGAFFALMEGGESKLDAVLGGGRSSNEFRRIDAHGFYWTSTSVNDSTAWFINFGKGRPALYLQNDGEKSSAFAVRCVKDN